MKNRSVLERLGDFALGKGFYIVLFLCVATIGISGYYLFQTMNTDQPEELTPAAGDASVVLPDSEANGPDPVSADPGTQGEPTLPFHSPGNDQPDDPEPVKQTLSPEPEEDPEPARPVATVFTWPVKGELLRDFSVETLSLDPTLGDWRTHGGLDIAASLGVEVLAMGAGTVTQVYEDGLMGTSVLVDHGNGLSALYCNLTAQTQVENGDIVEPGTVLGTVGDSAIAESGLAPHLHLEAWRDGQPVDPREFLPEK